jgi:hypothetical protein
VTISFCGGRRREEDTDKGAAGRGRGGGVKEGPLTGLNDLPRESLTLITLLRFLQ